MERRKQNADVLNGISVSDEEDVLYITGKFWDRMFKVKLLNKPPPTSSPTSPPTLPPTLPPSSQEDDPLQDDNFLGNDDRVYDTVNNSGNNNNKSDDTSSLLDEKIINDILDSTDGDDAVVNSNTNIGNDTTDNNTSTTPSETFADDDDIKTTENITQLVDTFFNSTTSNEDTISNNTTTGEESKGGKNEISSNSTTSDDTQDDDDISVGNGTITTNSTLGDVGNKTLNQNTTEENSDTNSDHIVSLDDIAKQIEEEKNSTLSFETNHTTTMNSTEIIEEEMKSAEEKINSSENGTRF